MPILKPEIQKVLRAAGLEKEPLQGSASELLSAAGLSEERIAEELTEIATSSGNESLKLKALETALRVHGSLKDQAQSSIPTFNIYIHSASSSSDTPGINPIVFPRQSLGSVPLKLEMEKPN